MNPYAILLVLVFAHCLGDYPLQGDFLAKAKNHRAPIAGVPWPIALGSHAVIQGGLVGLVTGSFALATAETVLHFAIDYAKSDGFLGEGGNGYAVDQILHIICKIMWVLMVASS